MAAAAGSRAAAVSPRTKPDIYHTTDGKIIVEDELLNFLAIKMRTLAHDDIVVLTINSFSSEWIETSKKILFELCPSTTHRCVSHKGPQKDSNNVKACLRILNECGENVPRFVSHYLDELPPIGYDHIDATAKHGHEWSENCH